MWFIVLTRNEQTETRSNFLDREPRREPRLYWPVARVNIDQGANVVRKLLILAGAAALSMGATVPASAQSAGHILRGTGIGAAGGVLAGAIIPGLSVGEGALIGAAAGTLHNTLIDKGHRRTYRSRHYRSTTRSYGPRTYASAPHYRSYRRAD